MIESDTQRQPGSDAINTSHNWDTEVPDWMIKRDQQMALRRQTVRRLSEMQWSFLCLATTALISVLAFRLAVLPPPPSPNPVQQIPAFTPPFVPVRAAAATPTPKPAPLAVESPPVVVATPPPMVNAVSTPYPSVSTPPISQPIAALEERRAEQEVTATELVREYQSSRVHAEERFNTKIISVTGTVKSRGRDSRKLPFIALAADGFDVSVRCLFDGKQKLDPEQVEIGAQVTVRGICAGSFVDVSLVECDLR